MFQKVLIANRGEIAARIIRACRELDIRTVAVFSQIDKGALHVRLADEAIEIGPPAVSESYLSIDRILAAARQSMADAIHPGYGLLSENSSFTRAVQDAGLVFIGPSADSIDAMGDKAAARSLAESVGVPVVPGYQGEDDYSALLSASERIGFPVLLKAAAGGGGKGMRVVPGASELFDLASAARREAIHAFGDGRLILEKYIPNAHHVEFQVLGDHYGNLIHLFERECSVQRRHQKIIEEAPSPLLDAELREKMGQAALRIAAASAYYNAGTVEFLVDPGTRDFYFLEMNTRLQVEHPITEAVSGLDLVMWQLRIARGERLPFRQSDLHLRGHALECRFYAEDPQRSFLPASGKILHFQIPQGPGIRVDSGITTGDEISVFYDPLIAKLIAAAEDRSTAIRRMESALRETVLLGLTTNLRFLQDVLSHSDFSSGNVHTTWVEENFHDWELPDCGVEQEVLIAAALCDLRSAHASQIASTQIDPYTPWASSAGFRIGSRSGDSL